jgi:hypothetical protein
MDGWFWKVVGFENDKQRYLKMEKSEKSVY